MSNPWFRMYSEAVDDEKLRLLEFEDRWHFVALLCCKSSGLLDRKSPLMLRMVAVKLGITPEALREVASRLAEVELIDEETLQPLAWGIRQFESDSSYARVKNHRERMKKGTNTTETPHETHETLQKRFRNDAVTPPEADTDTETDTETEGVARKRAEPPTPQRPENISDTVWQDFNRIRKTKLTDTAITGLKSEADKAGITLEAAMAFCCETGWQMFNAGWYAERQAKLPQKFTPHTSGPPGIHDPDSRAAIESLGIAQGIGRWNEITEHWNAYKARVLGRSDLKTETIRVLRVE